MGENYYETDVENIFACPFCTWESEDFDESDEHFTEHCAEYQQEQESIFGKYSK